MKVSGMEWRWDGIESAGFGHGRYEVCTWRSGDKRARRGWFERVDECSTGGERYFKFSVL